MKFLIYILCLCKLLIRVHADCDPNLPKTTQIQLKEKLLCGYDVSERPYASENNQTQVFLMFIPRYIEFDDSRDTIRLSTTIYMNWVDSNLQWSRTNYDLKYIPLKEESIWLPDFRIFNTRLIDRNLNTQGQYLMKVEHNGYVHYLTRTLLAAHCTADWTNWPLDKHVCNFTITSERYMGNEMDLVSGTIRVQMHRYIHSHEWELLEYKSFRSSDYSNGKNDSEAEYEVFLSLRFTIQRHSSVLAASFFTPAVVIFFVCSLFITAILICQTLIVGLMPSWTSKPVWQQTLFSKIGSNKILQFTLMPDNDTKKPVDLSDAGNEEGSAFVSNEDVGQHWRTFAHIVNRLTFLGVLMTHVIIVVYCFTL